MTPDDDTRNNVQDAMLKANGLSADGASPEAREKLQQLLTREEGRLRLSKRLVIGMWVAAVVSWLAVLAMKPLFETHAADWLGNVAVTLMIIGFALFPASIYATVRYLCARGSLGHRQVLEGNLQVLDRLERIERQLEASATNTQERE